METHSERWTESKLESHDVPALHVDVPADINRYGRTQVPGVDLDRQTSGHVESENPYAAEVGIDGGRLILSPRDVEHPMKAMLKSWYTKRHGYVEAEQQDFAAGFPDLAPLLAVPCDFTVYRKPLMPEE